MTEMKSLTLNDKTYDCFVDRVARSLVEASAVVGHGYGDQIVASGSSDYPMVKLNIYGKTTQAGTPTPDAPVELVSIGDGGSITLNVTEENKTQSMMVSTPNGLPGIPVTVGGNYTDANGQQWICDEIDLARGVYVRRVKQDSVKVEGFGNLSGSGLAYIYFNTPSKVNQSNVGILSEVARMVSNSTGRVENTCYENSSHVVFVGSATDTIETMRVKFADTGVLYSLATPIETPLSDEELAAAAALHTYRGDTTISNDAGAYMELEYVMDAKKYIDKLVGSGGSGGASTWLSSVTLRASAWTGSDSLYSQAVTISGITEYSKVDLLPSVEQLAIFHNKDVSFVTENEDGVVTVYAIGDKPTIDYTMQVSITEVVV